VSQVPGLNLKATYDYYSFSKSGYIAATAS
jgi:hypothetical protein